MRIIVWGINYAPELTGIAPFNTGLCDYLREKGHGVEMITTFPYYPFWQKIPGDAGTIYRTDDIDGVHVHRCWHYVPRQVTTLKRMWHEFSFGLTSFVRAVFLARADVYVIVSPPLILGPIAAVVCWLKRRPYVFHVQDLQPDAAVGLGMVKPGRFTRLLYRVESFSYRHAAAVSGISGGMLAAYERKGVPAAKRVLFPNWIRWYGRNAGVLPNPQERSTRAQRFRKKFKIPESTFLATYSGNLGKKQGLDTLVAAAALLRGRAGRAEDGSWKMEDGGGEGAQRAGDGRIGDSGIGPEAWPVTDDGRRTADDGRRRADDGRRTADGGLPAEARRAKEGREILILIVGDGVMRGELEGRIARLGLHNLRLMPLLLETDYHGMLAASDVGLILQAPGTGQFFLPSKLLSVLSIGAPVVTSGDDDSELAKGVCEGGFGVNVAPGNAEVLASTLAELATDPEKVRGYQARTGWVEQFTGAQVLGKFEQTLARVAGARGARAGEGG